MIVIYVLLLVAAGVCFLLGAIGVKVGKVGKPRALDLMSLGLLLWVAVPFLQMVQRL